MSGLDQTKVERLDRNHRAWQHAAAVVHRPETARNNFFPASFHRLADHLALLNEALELAKRVASAPEDSAAAQIVRRHRRTLDLALRLPMRLVLHDELKAILDDDPRFDRILAAICVLGDERRVEALNILAKRGVTPIQVTVGSPFDRGIIDYSDEPLVETTEKALDGRIAGVTPGNGGFCLGREVIVSAKARCYRFVATPRPAPAQLASEPATAS